MQEIGDQLTFMVAVLVTGLLTLKYKVFQVLIRQKAKSSHVWGFASFPNNTVLADAEIIL